MKQYLQLLRDIAVLGNFRGDRTGTGTQSIFGYQYRHNLQDGFPLLTTKKLSFHNIVVELIWFLKGDTNIKYLLENNCHIWSADAHRVYMKNRESWKHQPDTIQQFEECVLENRGGFGDKWGDLGPVYGKQWRAWSAGPAEVDVYERSKDNPGPGFEVTKNNTLDQINVVIESIKKDPEGRRHIVTAWNPAEIADMALPPCHCLFQFYVHDGRLFCHLYQRSADTFLGVPYNLASYALLTHIIAHQCGLAVGEFVHSFGDVHIYNNHRDAVAEQLSREPRPLPRLEVVPQIAKVPVSIDEYLPTDFKLVDYNPHPAIKGELSVGV